MFLIIDGSALAYASFFASSPKELVGLKAEQEREPHYRFLKRSPDGRYVGATELFVRYVLGFLSSRGRPVSHLAICFDAPREKVFRRKTYPEYKATRPAKPKPLAEELETIKTMWRDAGVRIYEHPLYEADDIAGSIARRFEREIGEHGPGESICILTKDKDYLQLVTDTTHVWMMRKASEVEGLAADYGGELQVRDNVYDFTPEVVEGQIGCSPSQITAWKAVSGDPSDNIPGVKGVGDKTILPLLREYGTLLSVYKEIQDAIRAGKGSLLLQWWRYKYGIRPSSIQKLWDGRHDASMFQRLVTIKTNIPVTASLSDFSVSKINTRAIYDRLRALGLEQLAEGMRLRFAVET